MDEFTRLLIIYTLVPCILGMGAYIMRSYSQRIGDVETSISHKVEEIHVRQLLDDKILPLREDIQELKLKIDKIFELLMNR